ncbi:MAG: pyridoxal phosphate enzyme (YggS family) [Oleiphilaceae bacterium]|jgi:pyridoxal phosphate enzyme (YggS family)
MFSIADNLTNVRQRIKKAQIVANRDLAFVQLLAVTKTRNADDLLAAMQSGLSSFGENYVNEAVSKQETLKSLCTEAAYQALVWHFIGPVQSNKTKLIAQHFDWVQSVDREKIAQRLNDQRPKDLTPLNVCIQVNINHEDSKSGLDTQEVMALAKLIHTLPHLTLRGLMTIPKALQSPEALQTSFLAMDTLFKQLKTLYPDVDTLSMGMSGDIEAAITNGSTMVRVGTALFGQRL